MKNKQQDKLLYMTATHARVLETKRVHVDGHMDVRCRSETLQTYIRGVEACL